MENTIQRPIPNDQVEQLEDCILDLLNPPESQIDMKMIQQLQVTQPKGSGSPVFMIGNQNLQFININVSKALKIIRDIRNQSIVEEKPDLDDTISELCNIALDDEVYMRKLLDMIRLEYAKLAFANSKNRTAAGRRLGLSADTFTSYIQNHKDEFGNLLEK